MRIKGSLVLLNDEDVLQEMAPIDNCRLAIKHGYYLMDTGL